MKDEAVSVSLGGSMENIFEAFKNFWLVKAKIVI